MFYAAIMFPNLEREQAYYDYVASNSEPVRTIHRAMNSLVRRGSAHFSRLKAARTGRMVTLTTTNDSRGPHANLTR